MMPTFEAGDGATASTRLFNTVELVETINLNIALVEILCGERVCKTWRGIITNNSRIQQALFFLPSQQRQDVVHEPDTSDGVTARSLLLMHGSSTSEIFALDFLQTVAVKKSFLINPFVCYAFEITPEPHGWIFAFTARGGARLLGRNIGWRTMLLSQPPARILYVAYGPEFVLMRTRNMRRVNLYISVVPISLPDTVEARDTELFLLRNLNGVTIGDLIDQIRRRMVEAGSRPNVLNGRPHLYMRALIRGDGTLVLIPTVEIQDPSIG